LSQPYSPLYRDITIPPFQSPTDCVDAEVLATMARAHKKRYRKAQKDQLYARGLYAEVVERCYKTKPDADYTNKTDLSPQRQYELEQTKLSLERTHYQLLELQLERALEVEKSLYEHLKCLNLLPKLDQVVTLSMERAVGKEKEKEKVHYDKFCEEVEGEEVQPMVMEETEVVEQEPILAERNVDEKGMLFIYLSIKKRRMYIQQLMDETNVFSKPYKATKKWRHLVRLSPQKRKTDWKPRPMVKRQRPGPMVKKTYDIYEQTGMFAEDFGKVFRQVEEDLSRPREGKTVRHYSNQLVNQARLALVLTFLRKGQDYNLIGEWGVSRSYVTREVRFIIPILAARVSFMSIPKEWPLYPFEKVVGAIDCSSHFRTRVHPHNHDYYRGDKKGHFLSAQVVCSLTGKIYDVAIFIGRVNDQMAFLVTWQDLLDREGISLLADDGYADINLISPTKMQEKHWNNAQKCFRSVIEHVNSIVHNFRYASVKVRGHSPELQAYCLKVIYNLSALILDKYPLRSDLFLAGSL